MNKNSTLYNLTVSGILIALGFVLSTVIVFPNMAPFQHMINVLAAVLVGPFYGTAVALMIGLLRMGMGRSINAVIGGVFGAFLSGFLYQKTKNSGVLFLAKSLEQASSAPLLPTMFQNGYLE